MARHSQLSSQQIARNRDLQRLDEDYAIQFGAAPAWLTSNAKFHLQDVRGPKNPKHWITVGNVPYVTSLSNDLSECPPYVSRGEFTMPLSWNNGVTIKPEHHWVVWKGNLPRKANGEWVNLHAPMPQEIFDLLAKQHLYLLSKDPSAVSAYQNHHQKVRAYVSYIVPEAQCLNPRVSAKKGDQQ